MALAVIGCLAGALLANCSAPTREKTLSYLFDGYKNGPPPPTQRVRRDLVQEIADLERELEKARRAAEAAKKATGAGAEEAPIVAERAKSWPEAARILPKDETGQVDWVQAVLSETIAPRPGLDPRAPEQGVLVLDVGLTSSATELFWVTFSHAAHASWLTCANCHPAIYPLEREKRSKRVTMAAIEAGESCGACHGPVAFDVQACDRCHNEIPTAEWRPTEAPRTPVEEARSWDEAAKLLPVTTGSPDWTRALAEGLIAPRAGLDPGAEQEEVLELDLELVPAESPAFQAIFPHEVHTVWLSCAQCHDVLFEMELGANPIDMAKIEKGESCGACHGPVAFDAAACDRCHNGIPGVEWRPTEAPRTPIEAARSWGEAAKLLPMAEEGPKWSQALAEGVIAPRAGLDPAAEEEEVMELDVELVPSFSRRFVAVFPHAAHTVWLSCESCHDEVFELEIGATRINMRKIRAGESCGICHGTVAFGVKACRRCHPDM